MDDQHWVKLLPRDGDLEATLVSLSERFGFARPKNGTEDIFIPGSALNGAFLGDEVVLTGLQARDKGPSGKVKRIVKKSEAKLTGTVHLERAGGGHATPDGALRYDLAIAAGDLHGAKEGDKVLLEPRQDGRGEWTRAVVKAVFGSGDVARVCADAHHRAVRHPHGVPAGGAAGGGGRGEHGRHPGGRGQPAGPAGRAHLHH